MNQKRYKRKDCTDRYRDFMRRMEQEYRLFKFETLSKTAGEIYGNCEKIYFYECLHEYFTYQEDLEPGIFKEISGKEHRYHVYQELWELYQEYEHLEIGTWGQIEDMLEFYQHQCRKSRETPAGEERENRSQVSSAGNQ